MDGILKKEEMDTAKRNRGVKRPYNCISNDEEEAETSSVIEDFCVNNLPLDILGIVFSFLDGRQQTRMRLVCPAWNYKILSPECSREMIVGLSFYEKEIDHYVLGAWFFHCITEWTRYVTITLSASEPAILWDDSVMLVLRKVMKCKNPLTALILYNMRFEPKMILTHNRTAVAHAMRTVCSRLIFMDITILCLFNPNEKHLCSQLARTCSSDADLRIGFGSASVDSQKELLACFEVAATDFADPKHHNALERVSTAITQANGEQGHPADKVRQNQIINVLKNWQKCDVRFGSNPEWKHVQMARLGANLLTLCRTTLAVLACLAKGWSDDDELDDRYSLWNSHSD